MITKPMLKPIRGFVEVEHNGMRMYKRIETGELLHPGIVNAVNAVNAKMATDNVLDDISEVSADDE